jgi:hypothetical protein
MAPFVVRDDHIYLEHFYTDAGGRHVHSVSIPAFAKMFETALVGSEGTLYDRLVASDPDDKLGYHKYFAKWKSEGLI